MRKKVFALSTKDIGLAIVFASFYAIFSSWNLFPLVGAGQGRFIQLGTLVAPLIGILIYPWLSVLTITIGGTIGFFISQTGPFGPLSFLPHVAAALCASLLINGKKWSCSVAYLFLFLVFAFYPVVGPAWLWPSFLWLHVAALVFLFSPLQSKVWRPLYEEKDSFKLVLTVGLTLFISTLFSHIVGSLMFEIMYWPSLISEVGAWTTTWQLLTFLYPLERILITAIQVPFGTGLLKVLKTHNFNLSSRNV
ncbi:MAG: hypothetical protein JSV51_02295 [Candidatus Bathyarchaeota archaeon]|nr:MAG: hypothetical protein JSV51_02295 [Candidatus Bathyarchaeota archaeon]